MREDDARRELEEILRNAEPGEEATVQERRSDRHPHGEMWFARKNWIPAVEADGSVTVGKLRSALAPPEPCRLAMHWAVGIVTHWAVGIVTDHYC